MESHEQKPDLLSLCWGDIQWHLCLQEYFLFLLQANYLIERRGVLLFAAGKILIILLKAISLLVWYIGIHGPLASDTQYFITVSFLLHDFISTAFSIAYFFKTQMTSHLNKKYHMWK